MNPDGLSYLDIASHSLSSGPAELVNGYWSPAYPTLIAVALFLFRPSWDQEFPLIHLVNFGVFLFALGAFSFFLRYWLDVTCSNEGECDSGRYLIPFAFAMFLWFSLNLIGLALVTPDLAVAGVVFLAAGVVCRVTLGLTSYWAYISLGLILGIGYYLKAAMFPLGLGLLAILCILPPSPSLSRGRLLLSVSVFLLVAAPFAAVLSVRSNRITFGETGRLNYFWYVNTSGTEHLAPKLMEKPLVLEFTAESRGTFPFNYDPSRWWPASAQIKFNLGRQMVALSRTLHEYMRLAGEMMPVISGGIVLLVLALSSRLRRFMPRRFLWQCAWPVATFVMYAIVHVEARFVGAFFVLLWLGIYGALVFYVERRLAVSVSATVFLSFMLSLAGWAAITTVRISRDVVSQRPPEYQTIARSLRSLGLTDGDRLAVVGRGSNCYYARAARLRVVAQIPDSLEFWRLSSPDLKAVQERLAFIGIRAIVTLDRPDGSVSGHWHDVNLSDSVRQKYSAKRFSILLL